ncbi:MAG: hypothetical protein ACRCR9_04355, partial [Chitinophagaceae bacterium]
IPLVGKKSEKKHWGILENTVAVVDYINKEKNIIHAITAENKEVAFSQIKPDLQIGDFVTSKSYIKKVKDEKRTELRQIQKIDKGSVLSKFQTQIAIVNGVNGQKQLFHFIISHKLQGIIKFTETNLKPNEVDLIKLTFTTKTDKDKKLRIKILSIEPTEEINIDLRKEIIGLLEVKYKNSHYDNSDENGKFNKIIPDFAFIEEDYYVPNYLLEKHNITNDCRINARVIYAEDKMQAPKWKVIDLQRI